MQIESYNENIHNNPEFLKTYLIYECSKCIQDKNSQIKKELQNLIGITIEKVYLDYELNGYVLIQPRFGKTDKKYLLKGYDCKPFMYPSSTIGCEPPKKLCHICSGEILRVSILYDYVHHKTVIMISVNERKYILQMCLNFILNSENSYIKLFEIDT
jgi:hypothetical protein